MPESVLTAPSAACFMHMRKNARYYVLLKGSNLQPGDTRVVETVTDIQAPVSHTVEFSAERHPHLEVHMGILSLQLQCKDTVASRQGPQPRGGGWRSLSEDSKSKTQVAEKQT